MWADFGFADPVSSFQSPVPVVIADPAAEPQVFVCFNAAWLPYIIGSLKQLVLQSTWATTDPDTLWNVQQRAMTLMSMFAQAQPCKVAPPTGFGGGGEEPMIRQDPDNPCLLQSSLDGINWCTFADLSKCTPASAQPGSGSPQPAPGGGQTCYAARLPGSGVWLIPTLLNTGDVINIQNAHGAVSSSYNGNWYCPSGSQFFGNLCVGFEQTHGGNPVPSAPDESLIVNIGGTYYSLNSGPFTVPGGVVNAQGFIQVNDVSLAGKYGELTFDVCVINNQAETWSVPQNLALMSGGWTPVGSSDGFDGGESTWTAGAGWQEVACHSNLVNTARYDIVYIDLQFTNPATVEHIDVLYDATIGDLSDGGGDTIQAYYSAAWHTLASQASANGTNRVLAFNGSQPNVEKLRILLYGADLTGTSCPTPGTVTLKSFNMSGVGIAPF